MKAESKHKRQGKKIVYTKEGFCAMYAKHKPQQQRRITSLHLEKCFKLNDYTF
jgi:hypothetical protein